jgi:hypothetical protein
LSIVLWQGTIRVRFTMRPTKRVLYASPASLCFSFGFPVAHHVSTATSATGWAWRRTCGFRRCELVSIFGFASCRLLSLLLLLGLRLSGVEGVQCLGCQRQGLGLGGTGGPLAGASSSKSSTQWAMPSRARHFFWITAFQVVMGGLGWKRARIGGGSASTTALEPETTALSHTTTPKHCDGSSQRRHGARGRPSAKPKGRECWTRAKGGLGLRSSVWKGCEAVDAAPIVS